MSKDSHFSQKRYIGGYKAVYRFADYGDIDNYWIELKYLCNRDDFHAVKTPVDTPLDFDLKDEDGNLIFGDIPSEHLEVLKSRGYVMRGALEPTIRSENDNLLEVSDLYVYAPKDEDGNAKQYMQYTYGTRSTYTIYDNDLSTTVPLKVDTDAGHECYNFFYNHTVLAIDDSDIGVLKSGDNIILTFSCYFEQLDDLGMTWITYSGITVTTTSTNLSIELITDNLIELDNSFGSISIDISGRYSTYDNCYIYNREDFLNVLNGYSLGGDGSACLRPTSGYITRAFSTLTTSDNTSAVLQEIVDFFTAIPDVIDYVYPRDENGKPLSTISRLSIPTSSEWKSLADAGKWYICKPVSVILDPINGIYKRTMYKAKYTYS